MGRSVTIKDFFFHLLPWLSCMSVTLPQSSLNQLLTCVLKPKTLNCMAIILIGVSTDCSPTLQPTWIGRGSHLLVCGTLKRCSLHGWILVFTIQDRWQTACEVLYWWCLLYVRGYGMGRCMLWTTNTGGLCCEAWGPLLCHSSMTITSCSCMIMDCPQGPVHNSWKLKTFQFLHGQQNYRTCHPLSMFQTLWIGVYDSAF